MQVKLKSPAAPIKPGAPVGPYMSLANLDSKSNKHCRFKAVRARMMNSSQRLQQAKVNHWISTCFHWFDHLIWSMSSPFWGPRTPKGTSKLIWSMFLLGSQSIKRYFTMASSLCSFWGPRPQKVHHQSMTEHPFWEHFLRESLGPYKEESWTCRANCFLIGVLACSSHFPCVPMVFLLVHWFSCLFVVFQ